MLRGFDIKIQHSKMGRSFLDRILGQHRAAGVISVGVQGTAHQDSALTTAQIAAIHEFGLGVPTRPFMRLTFEQRQRDIQKLGRGLEKRILEGHMTVENALKVMGVAAVGFIRATIDAGMSPALHPRTIARKGSSKPLVDTGQLKGSITAEVRHGR